jgi:sporadic carbohydrate cluster protein (TIGR04323 family)
LREYVANKNGTFILPDLESSFENCFHQLFGAINNLSNGEALVMYSLSMLPNGKKLNDLLDKCVIKKITLAFVLENFTVCDDYTKVVNDLNDYQLASLEFNEDRLDEVLSAS